MFRLILLHIIVCSNFSFSQIWHDSLVYQYVDSVWSNESLNDGFILNLDSTKMDVYGQRSLNDSLHLIMKYGYIQDSSGIYVFQIISSDLNLFLTNPKEQLHTHTYPKHTYFLLFGFFDGSVLTCYNEHVMLSGFGKEYPLFLKSIVNYSFRSFDMPFAIREEVRCSLSE